MKTERLIAKRPESALPGAASTASRFSQRKSLRRNVMHHSLFLFAPPLLRLPVAAPLQAASRTPAHTFTKPLADPIYASTPAVSTRPRARRFRQIQTSGISQTNLAPRAACAGDRQRGVRDAAVRVASGEEIFNSRITAFSRNKLGRAFVATVAASSLTSLTCFVAVSGRQA